jgi:calcium/calmodulin-dependent protein kinase I
MDKYPSYLAPRRFDSTRFPASYAPEVILREEPRPSTDMWSINVLTYKLLCGFYPFRSENMEDMRNEVRSERVIFDKRYRKGISRIAKDFIIALLQVAPEKTLTARDAL